MGRKKKKTYQADVTASCNLYKDNFGMLYVSMLKTPVYQALSNYAKAVYTACRVHASSESGRRALYVHAQAEGVEYSNQAFVFTRLQLHEYGLDERNVKRAFSELMEKGFIELLENNKYRQKPNVYKFSVNWKLSNSDEIAMK